MILCPINIHLKVCNENAEDFINIFLQFTDKDFCDIINSMIPGHFYLWNYIFLMYNFFLASYYSKSIAINSSLHFSSFPLLIGYKELLHGKQCNCYNSFETICGNWNWQVHGAVTL